MMKLFLAILTTLILPTFALAHSGHDAITVLHGHMEYGVVVAILAIAATIMIAKRVNR